MTMNFSGMRALRHSLAQMQADLRHLDSIAGAHLHALEASFGKVQGRKPVNIRAPHPGAGADPLSVTLSRAAGSLGRQAVSSALGGSGGRVSRGQALADLAAAVSRSLGRDL